MPQYKVKLQRTRTESCYAFVTASCPDEVCIEEGEVLLNEWKPDPWETSDFEQVSIEERK